MGFEQDSPPLQDDNGESIVDSDAQRCTQPVDTENPPRLSFPVVGVGASAGGLEAISDFLTAMRPDCGMAFVIILHLPPDRPSMLAEILSKKTAMPVKQIEQGMAVEPNHVYVIRPGYVLTIQDGALHLGERLEKPGNNRPVDDFFRSLAEEQRERAIAVIMSGMGSNGTAGSQAIKAVGGLCIAQEPETAQFPSMPRRLIDAGYADYILRPQDIPDVLLAYAGHPYARGALLDQQDLQHVREILAVLRTRTRHDFGGYKKPTIFRRIQRRMGLNRITKVGAYAKFLRQTASEVSALADDLLIHVTGFFRDSQAWEALREQVIVPLIASREPDVAVRAWVTACSSGEEAYTLAMLLVEEAERTDKALDIKVFATDMAERTLQNARHGLYPGGIETEITPERLERFFQKEDAVYRVRQELRERVVFAPQNLLHDPPFSRLDIVSCRNLLIYLEPNVQQRVLGLLHFGLRDGGALFLGTSETVGSDELFEPIDKKARIFRRIGPTRHGAVDFPLPHAAVSEARGDRPAADARGSTRPSMLQMTTRALLESHSPAAVAIDRDFRITYYHGNTEPFLAAPRGEPTRDLMSLVRESVRGAVRAAVHGAITQNAAVTVMDGWIEIEPGRRNRIAVTASPLDARNAPDYFLVSFQERVIQTPEEARDDKPEHTTGTATELQRVRDELQSTIEELQTSNEELKASHEEVVSINEELQSSNEELETSREEMQSLNEELSTVNSQLHAKMEEHQAASSDLSSLLTSTDIAVLFLDTHFRIRRFTPQVRDLMECITSDLGRPLSDLAKKFTDPDLLSDAETVLSKLTPIEREVAAENKRWYLRRITPYRTADNRIDGVVITFVEITARLHAEAALKISKEAAESANRVKDEFLATLSHELRTPLGAVLLWSKMLLGDRDSKLEEMREGLTVIHNSAEAQKELIEDLLDISRITTGNLRLQIREIELASVVRDAVDAIGPSAQSKGITVSTAIDPNVGVLRVDPDRLRQVTWNLLSNAVKFTPKGGRIDVSLAKQEGEIELRVADTGRGIGAETLPHIFERFWQGDSSYSRTEGGMGLGLAIARQLVELHGGRISVQSTGAGQGATFTVRLPLSRSNPRAKPPQLTDFSNLRKEFERLAGLRVLLVEDDSATREALTALLGDAGVGVTQTSSVEAALKAFEQHKPNLIISDIGLPGEDGYALIRRIRAHERLEKKAATPAVALTAFARDTDRHIALEAGFQAHLGKPVNPQDLAEVLRHVMGLG